MKLLILLLNFQVAKYKDPRDACAAIVAESYKLWLQYETRTDDITVIVVHISGLTDVRELLSSVFTVTYSFYFVVLHNQGVIEFMICSFVPDFCWTISKSGWYFTTPNPSNCGGHRVRVSFNPKLEC